MKATRPEGSSLGSELMALLRVVRAVSPRGAAAQSVAVLLLGLTDGVGLLLLVPVVAALDPTGSVVAQKIPVLSWVGLGRVSLGTALLALVGAVAVRSAMARWSSVARTSLQLRLIDTLRSECLDAVLHARWEFVLTRRRSDIVDTVTTGANRVGGAFDQCVSLAVGVVVAAVTAVVAVIISPVVAGVSVVVGLGAALVMVPVIRSARSLGRELGPRSRRAMAATTDALDALRLVRAHDAVTPWEGQVAAGFADLRVAQIRHARAAATNNAITSVLLMSGSAGFVLVAHRADLATGTLVVLLMVLSRMVRRILGVAQLLPSLGTSLAALGDLEQLRRSAQAAVEHTGDALAALPVPTAQVPLVELRGVTYRYPDGTTALVDLDLEIPLGEVTVLVGPSGAGKSTVVDLVLGLLRPTAGEVRVRGLVLDPEVLAAWRTLVGYVPQDTALLPGTLRDNLTWSAGRAEPDDEACWVALDEAAAHFARRLPKGLDTPLGDRGVRLSGGERQRVALARALVRRPELLILDEATSALDLDTEAEVLAVVRALCPTRTVLLVTHRIGSIAATDRVVPIVAVTPSGRTRQA